VDPTANLTFSIKLTEQEKSARDKLILPYMHHLKKDETAGKIFVFPIFFIILIFNAFSF
jgi:hypothetical protein